jgi:hypothetical protein
MFLIMLLYNFLVCLALLWLVGKNPRYMMQDYPPEITAGIPAQTTEEKRAGMKYGLTFLLTLAVFPLLIGLVFKFLGPVSFIELWLRIFVLMFSFNLVDLVILDWIIFCWLTPSFMVLPGTEGHPGYKNYRFHFIGFLKGTLIVLVASLVIAGLVEVVFALTNLFR